MEQALRCYTADAALSAEQVDELLRHPIPERWGPASPEASAASWRLSCALAIDPQALHFTARVAGQVLRAENVAPRSFTYGLWKADVVELFLVEGQGPGYYEFNLAADGAWWSQGFSNFRTADPDYRKPSGVETRFSEFEDSWAVSIRIPREQLAAELRFTPTTRANFCAILGDKPKRYFSLAPITTKQPDFHQSTQFLPLQLVPA